MVARIRKLISWKLSYKKVAQTFLIAIFQFLLKLIFGVLVSSQCERIAARKYNESFTLQLLHTSIDIHCDIDIYRNTVKRIPDTGYRIRV